MTRKHFEAIAKILKDHDASEDLNTRYVWRDGKPQPKIRHTQVLCSVWILGLRFPENPNNPSP